METSLVHHGNHFDKSLWLLYWQSPWYIMKSPWFIIAINMPSYSYHLVGSYKPLPPIPPSSAPPSSGLAASFLPDTWSIDSQWPDTHLLGCTLYIVEYLFYPAWSGVCILQLTVLNVYSQCAVWSLHIQSSLYNGECISCSVHSESCGVCSFGFRLILHNCILEMFPLMWPPQLNCSQ